MAIAIRVTISCRFFPADDSGSADWDRGGELGLGGEVLMPRPRIALLSNPASTGNVAQLPRIRAFCAAHTDIFHYEVEHAGQIGEAMKTIARVKPKVLVINGGDGTVQAALTDSPMAAILATTAAGRGPAERQDQPHRHRPRRARRSGRGLERLLEIAHADLGPHIVERELIALRGGAKALPVIGMFLGGAGLADTMLFCRNSIYPLGLPNGIAMS